MSETHMSTTPTGSGVRKQMGFTVDPSRSIMGSVDKNVYAKIGQTTVFRASPAVLHFGGFRLREVQRQTLEIVNFSDRSQRLTVMPPTTRFFRITHEKAGLLAPGMSQKVDVEFMPTEWRYYYDTIRVLGEEENALIPIHAYPVVNEVSFPSRLDLGKVPVGTTVQRVLSLDCKVPIQFEFELSFLSEHPDISVAPMEGIIPANSTVEILVTYRPVKLAVARAELELRVSQFQFKPMVCQIVGSASAQDLMDEQLQQSLRRTGLLMEDTSTRQAAALARSVQPPPKPPTTYTGAIATHDSAVRKVVSELHRDDVSVATSEVSAPDLTRRPPNRRDPGASIADQKWGKSRRRQKKQTGSPSTTGLNIMGIEVSKDGERVDGVRLPADVAGLPAANFVLTQQEGKKNKQSFFFFFLLFFFLSFL